MTATVRIVRMGMFGLLPEGPPPITPDRAVIPGRGGRSPALLGAPFGAGRHGLLWLALLTVSAVIIVLRPHGESPAGPLIAGGVTSLLIAAGVTVLFLGIMRFNTGGRPRDLLVGLALGSLGVSGSLVRIMGAVAPTLSFGTDAAALLLFLTRMTTVILLLAGLVWDDQAVEVHRRTRFAWQWLGGVLLVVVAEYIAVLALRNYLAGVTNHFSGESLYASVAAIFPPAAERWWQLSSNAAVGLALLLATAGYMALGRRYRDRHLSLMAMSLTLLFFSQLDATVSAFLQADAIIRSDLFRLAGYLTLLFSLTMRLKEEIASAAARAERMRLSRDLHDGLTQHLSLLHLRIARAAEMSQAEPPRELLAAQHLVERALLEARHAIASLRSGLLSWEEFIGRAGGFIDEFAENHGVAIRLTAQGIGSAIEVELQAELLLMLHEAFSNAIRHGAATQIEVCLSARPGLLELSVRDNGRGFAAGSVSAGQGVGLRSLAERLADRGGTFSIESWPGHGVLLRVSMPLTVLGVSGG